MLVLAQRTSLPVIGVVLCGLLYAVCFAGCSADRNCDTCSEACIGVTPSGPCRVRTCDVLQDYEGCYTCGRLQDLSDDTDCSTPSIADGKCMSGVCMSVTGSGGNGGGGAGGTGGTGGTGGAAVRCSAPLPSSDAFNVDGYATFDNTSPGGISFADDGRLFVANVGVLGVPSPEQNLPILWIDAAAKTITTIGMVNDPDVLIVDNAGLIANSGNVLVGGLSGMPVAGRDVGQLTELDDASGATVQPPAKSDPCIYNVSAMLFAQDDSLLLGNFVLADNGDDLVPAVCKVRKDLGAGWILADEFIAPLVQAVSGLAQAHNGDVFVSRTVTRVPREDVVSRYDSNGDLLDLTFADGILLGHGPADSDFDGLLVLRDGSVDLVDSDSTTGQGVRLLDGVTDGTGNSAAFHPNDENAVLYISQWELRRILRVSKDDLAPTDLGCGN